MTSTPHRRIKTGADVAARTAAIDAANQAKQQAVVTSPGGRVSAVGTQPARPVEDDDDTAPAPVAPTPTPAAPTPTPEARP